MPRIYFGQYGYIFSLNFDDAIKLAQNAIVNNSWDFNDKKEYKSIRELSKTYNANKSGFFSNRKWIDVNNCLDWEREDWEQFLEVNLKQFNLES